MTPFRKKRFPPKPSATSTCSSHQSAVHHPEYRPGSTASSAAAAFSRGSASASASADVGSRAIVAITTKNGVHRSRAALSRTLKWMHRQKTYLAPAKGRLSVPQEPPPSPSPSPLTPGWPQDASPWIARRQPTKTGASAGTYRPDSAFACDVADSIADVSTACAFQMPPRIPEVARVAAPPTTLPTTPRLTGCSVQMHCTQQASITADKLPSFLPSKASTMPWVLRSDGSVNYLKKFDSRACTESDPNSILVSNTSSALSGINLSEGSSNPATILDQSGHMAPPTSPTSTLTAVPICKKKIHRVAAAAAAAAAAVAVTGVSSNTSPPKSVVELFCIASFTSARSCEDHCVCGDCGNVELPPDNPLNTIRSHYILDTSKYNIPEETESQVQFSGTYLIKPSRPTLPPTIAVEGIVPTLLSSSTLAASVSAKLHHEPGPSHAPSRCIHENTKVSLRSVITKVSLSQDAASETGLLPPAGRSSIRFKPSSKDKLKTPDFTQLEPKDSAPVRRDSKVKDSRPPTNVVDRTVSRGVSRKISPPHECQPGLGELPELSEDSTHNLSSKANPPKPNDAKLTSNIVAPGCPRPCQNDKYVGCVQCRSIGSGTNPRFLTSDPNNVRPPDATLIQAEKYASDTAAQYFETEERPRDSLVPDPKNSASVTACRPDGSGTGSTSSFQSFNTSGKTVIFRNSVFSHSTSPETTKHWDRVRSAVIPKRIQTPYCENHSSERLVPSLSRNQSVEETLDRRRSSPISKQRNTKHRLSSPNQNHPTTVDMTGLIAANPVSQHLKRERDSSSAIVPAQTQSVDAELNQYPLSPATLPLQPQDSNEAPASDLPDNSSDLSYFTCSKWTISDQAINSGRMPSPSEHRLLSPSPSGHCVKTSCPSKPRARNSASSEHRIRSSSPTEQGVRIYSPSEDCLLVYTQSESRGRVSFPSEPLVRISTPSESGDRMFSPRVQGKRSSPSATILSGPIVVEIHTPDEKEKPQIPDIVLDEPQSTQSAVKHPPITTISTLLRPSRIAVLERIPVIDVDDQQPHVSYGSRPLFFGSYSPTSRTTSDQAGPSDTAKHSIWSKVAFFNSNQKIQPTTPALRKPQQPSLDIQEHECRMVSSNQSQIHDIGSGFKWKMSLPVEGSSHQCQTESSSPNILKARDPALKWRLPIALISSELKSLDSYRPLSAPFTSRRCDWDADWLNLPLPSLGSNSCQPLDCGAKRPHSADGPCRPPYLSDYAVSRSSCSSCHPSEVHTPWPKFPVSVADKPQPPAFAKRPKMAAALVALRSRSPASNNWPSSGSGSRELSPRSSRLLSPSNRYLPIRPPHFHQPLLPARRSDGKAENSPLNKY